MTKAGLKNPRTKLNIIISNLLSNTATKMKHLSMVPKAVHQEAFGLNSQLAFRKGTFHLSGLFQ